MTRDLRREVRLQLLVVLFFLLSISCISAAAQQTAAPAHFVVINPVANMYHQASEDSDVVSQAIYSENVVTVEGLDKAGTTGWVEVRTPDEYTGWMQVSALKRVDGKPYATEGHVVRVAQKSANVYREPDVTKHAPIVTAPWESRLEVVSDKASDGGRWLKVNLPDGRSGFVQTGDVSSDFTPLTIEQSIELAKKFLGTTYTWGGTSSSGYDCSGFTQMIVRQRGTIMPRDADVQAAWTGVVPVERKDLQPGDLLFFGRSADHITHTGMYIGNGFFIHDTTNTHPMVQISKLDDMPWTKLLVAQRRVKQEAQTK